MTPHTHGKSSFSLAEGIGLGACLLALVLLPFSSWLAVAPLALFLLLCLIAPFQPSFSFFLPIISRGRTGRPLVALTFDDGPDPVFTPLLLALLAKYQAAATFFVTGQKAERHPDLIRAILAGGHTIGNHSYSHDNFIMFKSRKALIREIQAAQQVFHGLGISPLVFRPPVGITNSRLALALDETGLLIVNFSTRAGDLGNRRIKNLSERILKGLRGDDVIMLHDINPGPQELLSRLQDEVEQILIGIKARGLAVRPLAELIGRPVMEVKRQAMKDES